MQHSCRRDFTKKGTKMADQDINLQEGALDDIDIQEESDSGNEAAPDGPQRFDISSYGWDVDVEGLVKRMNREDIYLPGFQRGFVWSATEKSRFIESLILGLPVCLTSALMGPNRGIC